METVQLCGPLIYLFNITTEMKCWFLSIFFCGFVAERWQWITFMKEPGTSEIHYDDIGTWLDRLLFSYLQLFVQGCPRFLKTSMNLCMCCAFTTSVYGSAAGCQSPPGNRVSFWKTSSVNSVWPASASVNRLRNTAQNSCACDSECRHEGVRSGDRIGGTHGQTNEI